MTITIRGAILGDERRLALLNGFVQELHVANRPDHFKPTRFEEVAAWFRTHLQNTSSRIWLAEAADAAVGYVLSIVHERAENPFCPARRWCEIDQIAVDPQYRRRGIARALLEKAVAAAAADGIPDVECQTWSFNEEAQQTFQRLGFTPKSIRWELRNDPA